MKDEELIRWTWEQHKGTITAFPARVPIGKGKPHPYKGDMVIFAEHRVGRRTKIIGTRKSSGVFVTVRE